MRWQLYHRKLLALAETSETLTASQQAVCQFLQQEIRDYQQRINLWGAPGVGKTFLAHHLHHCAEGLYFSSIETYSRAEISPNSVVIIDNAPPDRSSARSIFGDVLWAGASAVILVTRQPVDDAVRTVELGLTTRELARIEDVMRRLFGQFPAGDLREVNGIWQRLKTVAERNLSEQPVRPPCFSREI